MKGSPEREAVDRYLRRLRRRAVAVHVLRALVLTAGTGGLAFAVASMLVGPVASVAGSVAAWAAVGVAALAAAVVCLRPVAKLRGARAARLLDRADPTLVSAAWSAVELGGDEGATAPELVRAHQARTRDALVRVPPAQVVPWSSIRHPTLVVGVLAGAVAAVLVAGVDRAASGAFAMLHPEVTSEEGLTVAAVVASTEARLVFPAHVGRDPVVLRDADRIEAPRGTTVHYTLRPRIDPLGASLEAAGRNVRLTATGDGRYRGRFVVREGGELRIRIRHRDGRWLEDPVRRRIMALEDRAPMVAMASPDGDRVVKPEAPVQVAWEATDDIGLRTVELVVRMPDGRDERRPLASYDASRPSARGRTEFSTTDLGARPGDRLEVWVEAQDGDMVSGPNVGASEHRILTIASEATRRLETLAELKATVDRALHALADRLEWPVPEERSDGRKRFDKVRGSTERLVEALDGVADRLKGEKAAGGPRDGSIYAAMSRRVQRGLRRERRLHGKRLASVERRTRIDSRLVQELEEDALLLADLLGEARLQDAAALTRELESLRREMASLVAELRRTDSPEARRALRAAIARAQARMRDLMGRMAAMGKDVPSDFLNADAIARQQKEADTLESMRQALERGDLGAVEKQLMELEHQIGAIAEALGGAESEYGQRRFGPRQKAMAEAMDALAGLEAEQRELARRSDEVRREAAERALEAAEAVDDDQAGKLAERTREAREAIERIPERALGPLEDEALMRAKQRLVDSSDALDNGDLGGARRMANEAVRDLEGLARDLELSALMFPGADGRTGKAARAARQATERARAARNAIERSIPRMEDFLDRKARKRMRADAERQGRAADAADELAERFEKGPGGQPLSPGAAESVRDIRRSMDKAMERLGERDPVRAAQAQEDAARNLAELREELEKSQQSPSGGDGGGQGGADGPPDHQKRVRIPGAEEHQGPMALRRKLLDAMREEAPSEYQESVRRYYEELLR